MTRLEDRWLGFALALDTFLLPLLGHPRYNKFYSVLCRPGHPFLLLQYVPRDMPKLVLSQPQTTPAVTGHRRPSFTGLGRGGSLMSANQIQ